MSYHLQPKPHGNTKRSLKIVLAVAMLIFGLYAVFPAFFSGTTRTIGAPVAKSKNYIAQTLSQSKLLSSKASLVDENIRLRKQNDALEEKLVSFSLLSSQNDEFKKLLQVRMQPSGVGAVVVLHPSQSPYDVFDLELSVSSGVLVGNPLIAGNIALGTIVESRGSYAKAKLYSSPGTETEGRIVKNGTPIILTGKGGGNFVFSAPRDLDIEAGDIVSLGSNPDFALAKVGSVEEAETDSFKKVRLSFPISIFTLRFVEVLNEN
jgi:cell shape-determining protein MreC